MTNFLWALSRWLFSNKVSLFENSSTKKLCAFDCKHLCQNLPKPNVFHKNCTKSRSIPKTLPLKFPSRPLFFVPHNKKSSQIRPDRTNSSPSQQVKDALECGAHSPGKSKNTTYRSERAIPNALRSQNQGTRGITALDLRTWRKKRPTESEREREK